MNCTKARAGVLLVAVLSGQLACLVRESSIPGRGEDDGLVVVYRDTWGIPHIYAPTAEQGCYALGWAQAQDRPRELLKNFLRGMGEIASVEGPEAVSSDLMARLWDNYGVSRSGLDQLGERTRAKLQAFARGVNAYYRAHREDKPEWWGDRVVDEAMVIAYGRLFLNSWSIDDGFGDLQRVGIQPGFFRHEPRSSNQWAVSPARSAEGASILLIDPHLSWWGASRFWEFRIHAGDFVGSGFTLPGFPAIGLGHNEYLAWAMTTGGPDTADIYELTLKPQDPGRYLYDGEWRELTSREIEIEVANLGVQKVTAQYSHHGPVVAATSGKAYAMRMAYAREVGTLDAWFEINFGASYEAAVGALGKLQLFPQNVMVADTEGNIYYQRTGRVPKRSVRYDWSKPVDGTTTETEWKGFHPAKDLVQLLNPDAGYMQNCNIPPDAMFVDSPLLPDRYPDYVYSDRGHGIAGWNNQRGARAVELLSGDDSVTVREAIRYAMDIHPYGAERWIQVLRNAHNDLGSEFAESPFYQTSILELLDWKGQLSADSPAALKYFYWREQIGLSTSSGRDSVIRGVVSLIDDLMGSVRGESREVEVQQEQQRALLRHFEEAMERLNQDHGRLDLAYGEVFRVGRGQRSWPVGGGGEWGTSTLRNVSYGPPRVDKTRWGRAGQTSTQVVLLSSPIRSWTSMPIGQSDRPESPHYADQAEKLFSRRQMKETWWLPSQLVHHIESREVLDDSK